MATTIHTTDGGRGRALYEEFKARILDGTYETGSALPSTRACAAERGLSRTTVSAVYEQLTAEGFVETRPGAASRVAAGVRPAPAAPGRRSAHSGRFLPQLSAFGERVASLAPPSIIDPPRGFIDFAYGPLAGHDFPTLRWARAARQVERARSERMAYTDPRGDLSLRKALQAYVARARGLSCELGQIVVASGSQQVLDLCARLLLDPGDIVAVENPGYRMAHNVFAAVGAELYGIGVDAQGLKTDDLPRRPARLAYVTPTHQFPLGSFLSMPRRHALLAWAATQGAWVIEDDYDGEYRYAVRPEQTLQAIDTQGCVIYVGTFSKTLSPQLRLGYAVLPPPLADAFATAKQLTDRHAPTGPQQTLSRLLEDGSYDRHVRRMRRLQQARRESLLMAIGRHLGESVTVQGTASGLHVVLWVNGLPARREAELVDRARSVGVGVYALGPLYLQATGSDERNAGLVMGYALLDPNQIAQGVKKLAVVIRALSVGFT